MSDDDLPAQQEWIGMKMRDDFDRAPEWRGYEELRDLDRAAEWRGYFDDVVDVICTDAQRRDHRYGYGAEPHADQEARGGTVGRHAAKHGKPRRSTGNLPVPAGSAGEAGLAERVWSGTRNRAGAAALTAAAVVGTGVSAGVFGIVPFTPPAATSPGVAAPTSAAVPAVSSVPGNGATVAHHAGYVGKHRKPPALPSSSLTRLGAHPQTSPAGSSPSVAVTTAPAASPSSAGASAIGSHQAGSSSPASGTTQPTSPPSPAPSSSPSPSGTGTTTGTGTPSSGGSTSTGTGTPSSGGGTSGGLVGGLLGGVTGLVGGLLG